MEIKELKIRLNINQLKKTTSAYDQFGNLLAELRKKELPEEIVLTINNEIDKINSISDSKKRFRKQIRKTLSTILNLVEKDLKLVTKNHYQNTWLALGMAAFGIPLGVALGAIFGNMAFIGIGIPLGMALGAVIGKNLDKKALEEERQIDIEIKY